MRTLKLSTEAVDRISALNRQIHEINLARATTQNGSRSAIEPNYYRQNPQEVRLYETIESLSEVEKQELSAIAWIGREDFVGFDTALDYARISAKSGVVRLLSNKPWFKYLDRGVKLLKLQRIRLS